MLPSPLNKRVSAALQESSGLEPPRWGNLRRLAPFDRNWGYARGTPIDRVYIETFLARHADDIRGSCLEVLDAGYTRRFGRGSVAFSDVLDINPMNLNATVVADLGAPNSLPAARFDCFILTQTLHLVPDMQVALANAWHALRPGGVLLLTAAVLGRHQRHGFDRDLWRVTPAGIEVLLSGLRHAQCEVESYGNVLTCLAFLLGLAAEELTSEELAVQDPGYPIIVAARVRKPVEL